MFQNQKSIVARAAQRIECHAVAGRWHGVPASAGSASARGRELEFRGASGYPRWDRLKAGLRAGPPSLFLVLLTLTMATTPAAEPDAANPYAEVATLFEKHCLDCHSAQDPEGNLVMETHADLLKGGSSGPALVTGKSSESLLVRMIEGKVEKDGKAIVMPPGKRKKLDEAEVKRIREWIDMGAHGPPASAAPKPREIVVPKIAVTAAPRRSVQSLAYHPGTKLLAVGRIGELELIAEDRSIVRVITGNRGPVNDVVFSADGRHLFAAGGEAGISGDVRQWNVSDGALVRTFESHRDAVYAAALSPDGKILATGGYDQKILLWNVETGEPVRTLTGHNGCVFDLAFRPDGKILASASADRTVKLWDVASGERRDTLSQSLKELYAVTFSPDGRRLVAGGVDNRIRVWEISERAAETTNPLIEARFAHEGAILRTVFSPDGKTLVTSADDRTIKIWNVPDLKERVTLESQPDWAAGLAVARDGKTLVSGRLDGTLAYYSAEDGKLIPPPRPEIARLQPRGATRGKTTQMKLLGAHLQSVSEVKTGDKAVQVVIHSEGRTAGSLALDVMVSEALRRGSYDLWLISTNGESNRVKVHVDDLAQIESAEKPGGVQKIEALPVNIWGGHETRGEQEEFEFEARAGQTLVFDIAAKSLGSKAEIVLTLFDAEGRVLASDNGLSRGGDAFLNHTFPRDGRYRVQVSELFLGASGEHFYRLSIGALPYVTAFFPLSVAANQEADVQLIGFNLPETAEVRVKAGAPGEMDLPLDPDRFRSRRSMKLIVSERNETVEAEPNGQPGEANSIPQNGSVSGRIFAPEDGSDVDLFQFESKAGQTWVVETAAARRGSPLDSKIQILHADGKPVQRLLLQAVRNSAVTFRAIDSNGADCRVDNWEEMELNQYLYLQGEVVRLFRAPQGPDSGFVFYTLNGKRRTYFDTSATAHANEEPCYIVEPHPLGSKLPSNGLPVFPLSYENDDDGERRLGTDSKILFKARAEGRYLVRVSDTRGAAGSDFVYRLVVRESKPDFHVTLSGANLTVPAGSGQSFSVTVDRVDGFDEELRVEISSLPEGFTASTPLIIQAGHTEARGTLFASIEAPAPTERSSTQSVVTVSARIGMEALSKTINNFGRIKLGDKPKLFVSLEPASSESAAAVASADESKDAIPVITIAPGRTVPAWLKVKRNGHDELITFTVDNLPHGVIVDNIGLSGVLIPKDQNEREIFFSAARWVPETDRLCFAIENQAGRQTSRPILLRVRNGTPAPATAAAR